MSVASSSPTPRGVAASRAPRTDTALLTSNISYTCRNYALISGIAIVAAPVLYRVVQVFARKHRADLIDFASNMETLDNPVQVAPVASQQERQEDEGNEPVTAGSQVKGAVRFLFPSESATYRHLGGTSASAEDQLGLRASYTLRRNTSGATGRRRGGGGGGGPSITITYTDSKRRFAGRRRVSLSNGEAAATASSSSNDERNKSGGVASSFSTRAESSRRSFLRVVLASQRASRGQFARTCAWDVTRRTLLIVLRTAARCCARDVLVHLCMFGLCAALMAGSASDAFDSNSNTSSSASAVADPHSGAAALPHAGGFFSRVRQLLVTIWKQPIAMAPSWSPSPTDSPGDTPALLKVNSFYALSDFATAALMPLDRLVPHLSRLRFAMQRVLMPGVPVQYAWQDKDTADAVWRALTPKGVFFAVFLKRLPFVLGSWVDDVMSGVSIEAVFASDEEEEEGEGKPEGMEGASGEEGERGVGGGAGERIGAYVIPSPQLQQQRQQRQAVTTRRLDDTVILRDEVKPSRASPSSLQQQQQQSWWLVPAYVTLPLCYKVAQNALFAGGVLLIAALATSSPLAREVCMACDPFKHNAGPLYSVFSLITCVDAMHWAATYVLS